MVDLTPEQRQAAQARGRHFVVATDEQVATLSMQRRVFRIGGRAYLAVRTDGFLETAATLLAVLRQPLPEGEADAAMPAAAAEIRDEPPPELQPAEPQAAEARSAELPPPEPRPQGPDGISEAPPPAPAPGRAPAMAGLAAPGALAVTARLVASYVATNRVPIADLDALIRTIHRTVLGLRQPRGR